MTPQSYNSYQYSYNLGSTRVHRSLLSSSPKEVKHITVAAALLVAIGFSIGIYGKYYGGFNFLWTWTLMAIFAAILTGSMLTHEIAHKITAQQNGLWAEFRLTTWGLVLTFISIFLPIRMIAPGAMMISGTPNGDEIVKISIAGPITNMIFASVLIAVAFPLLPSSLALMLFFAAYINAFMAVFNLVPFGILDGFKIFSFNKKYWAIAFAVSIALMAVAAVYTFLSNPPRL